MKLSEIAARLGCSMESDTDMEIIRIAGISEAGTGDLTFVSNRKYISQIKTTKASAVILGLDIPPVSIPSLRTANPYLAFAKGLELFHTPLIPEPGIHPNAVIAPDAIIGPGASIAPYVVLGHGCNLGARATIYPHVVIYPGVIAGDDCIFHSGAVIREFCRIGNRVCLQNGAVIGSDGFGFAPKEDGSYYKIPQTGIVIIEDDVEIGANTAVDRAAVGDTIIRAGAKLDNLVQVGHGSSVGENSVIAAQVGLAGSTHVGRNVKLGGQAGLAGHLQVGDSAIITAQSGTSHDIEAGAVMSGSPASENEVWLRYVAALPRLPDLVRRVRELEKSVRQLKEQAKRTK
jgi:UDP-3-O-[3-hydroxymyristoyl] glucosamine N-acyltransferase